MGKTTKRKEDEGAESGAESKEEEEEEFIVEKVLAKRIRNGRVEYFLRWKGYSDSENTWEPDDNLDCPDLIQEFEENEKRKREQAVDEGGAPAKRKSEVTDSGTKKRKRDDDKPRGFDRGLDPDRILGATDSNGELTFLIKWKNTDEADLVPAKIANVRCPQIVIKFYEERLTWQTHTTDKN
uniref:Heterochromatin protein 1 n=1 Tax=Plectus sambesii TaxID=2011161 RepID=A0A914XNX5_9BILA